MKSSDEIIATLLDSIGQMYDEPQMAAWTQCGLDGLLYQLHWHYAHATDQTDAFAAARLDVFLSDVSAWRQIHRSPHFHRVSEHPDDFKPVIDEWKKLDMLLGVRPERAPRAPA